LTPEYHYGSTHATEGLDSLFGSYAAQPKLLFRARATRVKTVAVAYKRPFFTSYTTSLWIRFLRFGLQSHKKLEADLDKVGLTPPQFYVLATIGYAGGLPFGEIGHKMMVTVSN